MNLHSLNTEEIMIAIILAGVAAAVVLVYGAVRLAGHGIPRSNDDMVFV